MTKEQLTFMPKDNFFRAPADDQKEPIAEVETTRLNSDDVRYKDKYFQLHCKTEEL